MADNKTVLFVDLVKNSNQKSDNFGRYYGRAVRTQTLSTRALARHIADHNSVYGRDVIEGVLVKFSECIPELVAQGIGVCYEGGLNPQGKPADTRTDKQKHTLLALLCSLKLDYPDAVILGHRDLPGVKKACPCFDARAEYRDL